MQRLNYYFLILSMVCMVSYHLQAGGRKRSRAKQVETALNNSVVAQNEPFVLSKMLSPSSEQSHSEVDQVVDVSEPVVVDNRESLPEQILQTNLESLEQDTMISGEELEQESDEEKIELNFENADLQNVTKQIADIFDVTFIMDDSLDPLPKTGKALKGNKISFKTQVPLSRTDTWNLFVTFLQIAGFTVIELPHPRTYRIAQLQTALKLSIPSFIGTDYKELPDNDEMIRYVYFIENSTLESIKTMVDALRSTTSSFILLAEQKAFILTDRAYNIKVLMEIIKALDKVTTPQSVSVLKLKHADAKQVKDLYDSIIHSDDKSAQNKLFTRKQPTTLFFPENIRLIAEPRTNSLILLGPEDAIAKVEKFIKHCDKELDQPYSPLYVHQLRYADASTVAEIMNSVTQFGKDTEAGKSGGVRGVDKYMQPMSFVAEKETNRLIIKGYYNDYLKAKEIIEKLDEPQPQVAIEVLLLAVNTDGKKSLGAQIRSKDVSNGLWGNNVKFQTSGLFGTSGIVENSAATLGVNRLLGNLLNLVQGAAPGNTILALGSDALSVWGVLQILESVTNTQVISNPFLLATNKTPAVVSLGEERRVQTALVVGTNDVESFGKDDANLKVEITPQINSDGMIVLDLRITYDNFVNTLDFTSATKNIREIKTSTVVSDKEVLALGGFIRDRIADKQSKIPILGDIPILGWLFKNKQKEQVKDNVLVLISARIVDPTESKEAKRFTRDRIADFHGTLDDMQSASDNRDPIHKIFFQDQAGSTANITQNLIFERHNTDVVNKRKRARRGKKGSAQEFLSDQERTNLNVVALQTSPQVNTNISGLGVSQVSPELKNTIVTQNRQLPPDSKIIQKKRTPLSLKQFLSEDAQGVSV